MKRNEKIVFSSEVKLSDGMVHFISKPKANFLKDCCSSLINDDNATIWDEVEILLYSNIITNKIIYDLIQKHGNKRDCIFSVEIIDEYDGIWQFDIVKLKHIDFGYHTKENLEIKFNVPMLIKMVVDVDNCKFIVGG